MRKNKKGEDPGAGEAAAYVGELLKRISDGQGLRAWADTFKAEWEFGEYGIPSTYLSGTRRTKCKSCKVQRLSHPSRIFLRSDGFSQTPAVASQPTIR